MDTKLEGLTPLFSLNREKYPEVVAWGHFVAVDGNGVFWETEKAQDRLFPARSLLKPFQFWSGKHEIQRWDEEEKTRHAACIGSVSATIEQVEQLKEWYAGNKLCSHLKLPKMYPLDEWHRAYLKKEGIEFSNYLHMCFSKHMGVLESCAHNGWDLESYNQAGHPYHAQLIKNLKSLLGSMAPSEWVTDGCELPTPIISLRGLASLYQSLVSQKSLAKILELMIEHPQWIGGPGRLDTELMEKNTGQVIAKEGADGLWAVGVLPSKKFPTGLGMVLKLYSGFHAHLATYFISHVLTTLGFETTKQKLKGQTLQIYSQLEL